MLDKSTCTKLGSIWAIAQGLFAFLAPRLSVSFVRKMLQLNFENADGLEPRESYLRQIRAFGVGLAAAGIAGYVMELVSATEDADDSSTST